MEEPSEPSEEKREEGLERREGEEEGMRMKDGEEAAEIRLTLDLDAVTPRTRPKRQHASLFSSNRRRKRHPSGLPKLVTGLVPFLRSLLAWLVWKVHVGLRQR